MSVIWPIAVVLILLSFECRLSLAKNQKNAGFPGRLSGLVFDPLSTPLVE